MDLFEKDLYNKSLMKKVCERVYTEQHLYCHQKYQFFFVFNISRKEP